MKDISTIRRLFLPLERLQASNFGLKIQVLMTVANGFVFADNRLWPGGRMYVLKYRFQSDI